MNYIEHYNRLNERTQDRVLDGYTERHHIVPKCMGGGDDPSNISILTAREHYVAHLLLVKIYPHNRKLIFAAHRMTSGKQKERTGNILYAWLREKHAKNMSVLYKGKTYEERYGKEYADAIKAKRSASLKGKPKSEAHREALKEAWKSRVITDNARKIFGENARLLSQNKIARQKQAEKLACNWLVTDPQGKTAQIKNLRKYCRDNNLPFQSVHKGFKGWTSQKINEKTRS